jgi:hypothetical protein
MNSSKLSPFDAMEPRLELRRRLEAIGDVQIPERMVTKPSWPSVALDTLAVEGRCRRFLEAYDWARALVAPAGGGA